VIRFENHLGFIDISQEFFANLVGTVASSCFGVAGMASSGAVQGIRSLIMRKDLPDQGVRVRGVGDKLVIDLHIIVTYGVNISAIVKSIVHKVRYTVEDATGLSVAKVNVFVDGMKTE